MVGSCWYATTVMMQRMEQSRTFVPTLCLLPKTTKAMDWNNFHSFSGYCYSSLTLVQKFILDFFVIAWYAVSMTTYILTQVFYYLPLEMYHNGELRWPLASFIALVILIRYRQYRITKASANQLDAVLLGRALLNIASDNKQQSAIRDYEEK